MAASSRTPCPDLEESADYTTNLGMSVAGEWFSDQRRLEKDGNFEMADG